MNSNAIQNHGQWRPIGEWLDQLTTSGLFKVPLGDHPAVTRRHDGTLEIWEPETGDYLDRVPVGDWLIFSFGGFISAHYEHAATDPIPTDNTTHHYVPRAGIQRCSRCDQTQSAINHSGQEICNGP